MKVPHLVIHSVCHKPGSKMSAMLKSHRACKHTGPAARPVPFQPSRLLHLQQCRGQQQGPAQHGVSRHMRVQAGYQGSSATQPHAGHHAQVLLPASAPLALVLGPAAAGQLATSSQAAAALAVALFQVVSILFIGYSCSFLVASGSPLLVRIGAAANQARKTVCSLLQWAHVGALVAAAAWYVVGTRQVPAALQDWIDVVVVLAAVGSINVMLLGWIELRQRITSKAVQLQLDSLGPGAAHPVMVQGAQVAGRHFVSYWVVLLNALVAALTIPSANPQGYVSAVIAALMLVQYVSSVAAGEREEVQHQRGRADQ